MAGIHGSARAQVADALGPAGAEPFARTNSLPVVGVLGEHYALLARPMAMPSPTASLGRESETGYRDRVMAALD